VVASAETWPIATCVPIVYNRTPTSHVWLATFHIGASTTLTEIKGIFHKDTVAICGAIVTTSKATCSCYLPSISSVNTFVPEKHACMTAMLKHFQSHHAPSPEAPRSLPITPPVQAIIVDRVPIIYPQLASIIRNNAEAVIAKPVECHTRCPSCSKVVTSRKTRPPAASVSVVHGVTPTSHVWATPQVRTTTAHSEIEGILPEQTSAISNAWDTWWVPAACTHDVPSISSVTSPVPEKHAGMTTMLEHLQAHKLPSPSEISGSLTIAPAMQAIVVDSVPTVNPQLASIIGNDAEAVMA
jgi:hypothetical protein